MTGVRRRRADALITRARFGTERRFGKELDPFGGGADVGEFGGDGGKDAGADLEAFAQDAQGVLAHVMTGKELGGRIGEVQTGLKLTAGERNTEIMIGQEQAALRVRGRAARIEKPSGRANGINMQQLQEFLFELPEIAQRFLSDVERAEGDDAAQESNVGGRIRCPSKDRQLESLLETRQIDRRPVQSLGHVGERMHGGKMLTSGCGGNGKLEREQIMLKWVDWGAYLERGVWHSRSVVPVLGQTETVWEPWVVGGIQTHRCAGGLGSQGREGEGNQKFCPENFPLLAAHLQFRSGQPGGI